MSALHKFDVEPRVVVALAIHAGRVQAHVRTFLNGPGRDQFAIGDLARSHALIADYDNELSRTELHGYLLRGQGPALVLALADPGLPGTVWVPKPVQEQALLAASQIIAGRVLRRKSPPVAAFDRASLRLLPPSVQAMQTRAEPARHRPSGRALRGPFGAAKSGDWTSRILWLTLGGLLIVAAVTSLGWRPSDGSHMPAWPDSSRPASSGQPNPDRAQQELLEAIDDSLPALAPRSSAQQSEVKQEVIDYLRMVQVQPVAPSWETLSRKAKDFELPRLAFPMASMADASAPWPGQAELRAALAVATQDASVETSRVD